MSSYSGSQSFNSVDVHRVGIFTRFVFDNPRRTTEYLTAIPERHHGQICKQRPRRVSKLHTLMSIICPLQTSTIALFERTESYPLSSVIGKPSRDAKRKYIYISGIFVMYANLLPAPKSIRKIDVSIQDRGIKDMHGLSSVISESDFWSGTTNLSYIFPRDRINDISIVISQREPDFSTNGVQWGAARIFVSFEESPYPFQQIRQSYGSDVSEFSELSESTENTTRVSKFSRNYFRRKFSFDLF